MAKAPSWEPEVCTRKQEVLRSGRKARHLMKAIQRHRWNDSFEQGPDRPGTPV